MEKKQLGRYGYDIRGLLELTGLSMAKFSKTYGIPLRTVESWAVEKRCPPKYVIDLLEFKVLYDHGQIKA